MYGSLALRVLALQARLAIVYLFLRNDPPDPIFNE